MRPLFSLTLTIIPTETIPTQKSTMPTINKGDKVLVSGANGYLAMWVMHTFLERGYSVRGTVRNDSKAKYVRKYFTDLGYSDKLELVVVEDITKPGAFDEAVKGVQAIAHTSSPFHTKAKNPDDLIRPAVDGTLGMLKSAKEHGTSVKRIVVTSSCAAVLTNKSEPSQFSEKDWNELAIQQVKEQGDKTDGATIYLASKTLAEKAAWKFAQDNKANLKWDLSVINPPYIFGPPIHELSSMDALNTSLQLWVDTVLSTKPKPKEALLESNVWVDVRDVALAHALALEKQDAGGERVVIAAGPYNWQEWLDAANASPSPLKSHQVYKGDPELIKGGSQYKLTYDTSKERRLYGIKFHTKEETAKDTLAKLVERGLLH